MIDRALVAVFSLAVLTSNVHAQTPSDVARAMSTSEPSADSPRAADTDRRTLDLRLMDVRLAQRAERRREGFWLFGWGVANAVGGTIVAIARRDDQAWLAAGVTTASFGVIDAVLAFGLLDLGGTRRRMILDGRSGVHTLAPDVREAELTGQLRSAQGFAFNAGLDVFYMAAGILLYALGRVRSEPSGWEEGAGLAMVGQGAFLLGFDLVAWIRSNRRAETLRALH